MNRVTVSTRGLDLDDVEPGSLSRLIAALEAIRDQLAPEHRDLAVICIGATMDYDLAVLEVECWYDEPAPAFTEWVRVTQNDVPLTLSEGDELRIWPGETGTITAGPDGKLWPTDLIVEVRRKLR